MTGEKDIMNPKPSDERNGNFLDSMWCCKVCDGEIPDGHTPWCDMWKLEMKHRDFIAKEHNAVLTERDQLRVLVRDLILLAQHAEYPEGDHPLIARAKAVLPSKHISRALWTLGFQWKRLRVCLLCRWYIGHWPMNDLSTAEWRFQLDGETAYSAFIEGWCRE